MAHERVEQPYAKLADIKAGDKLIADGGFTCMKDHDVKIVRQGDDGLFINCDVGRHYLNGQHNDAGELVGLRKV